MAKKAEREKKAKAKTGRRAVGKMGFMSSQGRMVPVVRQGQQQAGRKRRRVRRMAKICWVLRRAGMMTLSGGAEG